MVTVGKGKGQIRTQLCGVASCGTVSHVTTVQLAPWAGPGFSSPLPCPLRCSNPTPGFQSSKRSPRAMRLWISSGNF